MDSHCHDSPERFDWVQVRTLSSLPELTLWLENTALLEGELSTLSEAPMLQIRFTSACPGIPPPTMPFCRDGTGLVILGAW